DTYIFQGAGAVDTDKVPAEKMAAMLKATNTIAGATIAYPMNSNLAHHYVLTAAVRHLDRWVRGQGAPPKGAPIEINPSAEGAPLKAADFVVDEHGNVRGGIRNPWVDVPVAKLVGLGNSGAGFAFLVGITEPFDAAKLARLYPGGKADYLAKFDKALDRTVT